MSATATTARKQIHVTIHEDVAVLKFDDPSAKVNTLNSELMPEFLAAFDEASKNDKVKSIVFISGKTSGFIAGADVNMIQAAKSEEEIYKMSRECQKMLDVLEKSKKPVVSAIMGTALGGGLEVALASHYRIAVDDNKTVVGLPEVKLGLLPGGGGTQRLPKLISLPDVLDMTLTGKFVKAKKAKSLGIIDLLVPSLGPGLENPELSTLHHLESIAISTARKLGETGIPKKPKKSFVQDLTARAFEYEFVRDYVFKQARAKVIGQTKGLYPAPLKILDVIKTGLDKGAEAGYEAEARGFAQLGMTNESKALIGLFQSHTQCKKSRFEKPKLEAKTLGVLGAGLMGAGVSSVSIDKGYKVFLKDMSQAGMSRGYNQIAKTLRDGVKKKKFPQVVADRTVSNLNLQLDYANFDKVDMVIEAVFEDINIKHRVVQEVEKLIRPDCIFASNTSALPIGDIAKVSVRPDKFIGMHYFSPVEKMELLEIVITPQTSQDTIASAVQVGLKQGKVVIVVKDGPGFYTTRVLQAGSEVLSTMMREGVDPKLIDKAAKSFGFPVGNATLIDEVGIDVASHINDFLGPKLGQAKTAPILSELVKSGSLGRKSGKGIYVYEEGVKGGERQVNPIYTEIINKYKQAVPAGITNDIETIQWRLNSKSINESLLCLQEGILANPVEGDIGAVFGLGFPPMKGGPFRFVDIIGAQFIVDKLRRFEQIYGASFTPCELLLEHAKNPEKKFYK